MNYSQVAVERRGSVAWLFRNRPEARNAESMQLLDELNHALDEAVHDDGVRVIVIGGKGDHFSAGHDLKGAQDKRAAFSVEERFAYEERRYLGYGMRIWDLVAGADRVGASSCQRWWARAVIYGKRRRSSGTGKPPQTGIIEAVLRANM
ncbi:enoyl-CoA hydratase-related protein [Mesorhizobium sp. B4-1-4]|uniref:enoyl-CoA hydratase-related protein n=1 Tax=Mesorhizobium sp. B4-1-4 TaxID=2589888 RepID=UPI00112BB185|nr:enoyl-CoA hydratase-related protein [Mesorhizobium sp. B4-1-4]UCI31819.1 enoyl-CoA hydratase/isomerase family protein [Mesorhizobium sp. B4-1-4]